MRGTILPKISARLFLHANGRRDNIPTGGTPNPGDLHRNSRNPREVGASLVTDGLLHHRLIGVG